METNEHDDWDTLAAGYALHALSPEEDELFAAHLETCDRCQSSVDDHALVAAQLGAIALSETSEAPSWESIRDAVIGAGQDPQARSSASSQSSDVIDLAARRRRYDVSRRVLAAAAVVAVLAGGGIVGLRHFDGGSSSPQALKSCATTTGCHTISLDATSGVEAAALTVKGDTITMMPTGMKPAAAGSEYVLWQQPSDGRPVAVKVFTATGKDAVSTATTAVAYSDTASFAISVEHSGAVPSKPTTPLLAVGSAT
jgi:anti-sigma-K factor RskA